jgi:hypothetical protein
MLGGGGIYSHFTYNKKEAALLDLKSNAQDGHKKEGSGQRHIVKKKKTFSHKKKKTILPHLIDYNFLNLS